MKLEEVYQEQLNLIQIDQVLSSAQQFTKENILSGHNWFSALAHLQTILENKIEAKDQIIALYNLLTNDSEDFTATVYLSDEDFEFIFQTLNQVLIQVAPIYPEAYLEHALQYLLSRRTYVDIDKTITYLDIATEHQVEAAEPIKLFYSHVGLLPSSYSKDQLEIQVAGIAKRGNPWGRIYLAYMKVWSDNWEETPAIISGLDTHNNVKINKHYYQILQAYYRRKEDFVKQEEVLLEAIEKHNSAYAQFIYAEMQLQKENVVDKTPYLEMLQTSFERGLIDAANGLALHKLPKDEVDHMEAYSESLKWFELSWLYGSSFAAFRLALLYIYNPLFNQVQKGVALLEEASKKKNIDAEMELAEILLQDNLVEKDEARAFEIFSRLAEEGVPYAQLRMGNFHEYGLLNSGEADLSQAFKFYELAATKKVPQAIYQVGRYLKYGIHGQEPDIQKSIPYFEEAAAANNAPALTELGLIVENQESPDYAKAFEYFHQAAELGYPYANYLRGLYLENNYHQAEQINLEAAFASYQRAAAQGLPDGLYEAGRCLKYAVGTSEDPDQAIKYIKQAAEAGHAKALTELALSYERSYGVSQDFVQAEAYMKQAAELGYFYAQYQLGRYYMHGLNQQDTTQAIHWLEKVAELNYPYALLELADYYMYDYDQINEYDKALSYYERAAAEGVLTEGLGMCYEYGIGTEPQEQKAFEAFLKASENGVEAAKYRLGRAYYFGIGTEKNEVSAFRWFNEAAQADHQYSKYFAGLIVLDPNSGLLDEQLGIRYMREAAEAEIPEAQFKLGNCYLMGEAVEEDENQALYWFEKAAENGHQAAQKIVKSPKR